MKIDNINVEDAIKNAISIGGDSDTVAAITGSIAEGMFGVPDWVGVKTLEHLPDEFVHIMDRCQAWRSGGRG